jgi:ribosomal protein L37AE/L43A
MSPTRSLICSSEGPIVPNLRLDFFRYRLIIRFSTFAYAALTPVIRCVARQLGRRSLNLAVCCSCRDCLDMRTHIMVIRSCIYICSCCQFFSAGSKYNRRSSVVDSFTANVRRYSEKK